MNQFKRGDVVRAVRDVGPESNPPDFKLAEAEEDCVRSAGGGYVVLWGKRGSWTAEHFELVEAAPTAPDPAVIKAREAAVESLRVEVKALRERVLAQTGALGRAVNVRDAWRTIAEDAIRRLDGELP